jgi:hypothetical protein
MPTDDERTHLRAGDLLPEEAAAGVDDPEAMAAAVLAESDERQADRDAAPGSRIEHGKSPTTES